jgi:hypothetical protein
MCSGHPTSKSQYLVAPTTGADMKGSTVFGIPSRNRPLSLGVIIATLVCAAYTGAAAAPSQASLMQSRPRIPVVEVTVDSSAITGPATLRPGYTTFHTTSTHPGTDSLAVVRLHQGVSYAQIFRYLRHGNLPAVFRHVAGKGGIAHGGPHNGRRWTTYLHPGRHLFVDDEANLFAKFRVTGRATSAPRPHTNGTVQFRDGAFTLPRHFNDGNWRLHNGDTMQHELGLVRILRHHTRADVVRVLRAGTHPTWLEAQATVNLVGPGRNAFVRLRDLHGFYVFLDYLPMFQGAADGPVARFRHIR